MSVKPSALAKSVALKRAKKQGQQNPKYNIFDLIKLMDLQSSRIDKLERESGGLRNELNWIKRNAYSNRS